jgi:hypothetical protein
LPRFARAARRERPRHLARIASVLAGGGETDAEVLLSAAGGEGVLTLNFHPDRVLADGRSVAEALYVEGVSAASSRRASPAVDAPRTPA